MKTLISAAFTILCLMPVTLAQKPAIKNPAIDMDGYLRIANEAAATIGGAASPKRNSFS